MINHNYHPRNLSIFIMNFGIIIINEKKTRIAVSGRRNQSGPKSSWCFGPNYLRHYVLTKRLVKQLYKTGQKRSNEKIEQASKPTVINALHIFWCCTPKLQSLKAIFLNASYIELSMKQV